MNADLDSADTRWLIAEDGFTAALANAYETLFTTGNGYLGTRGSLEEGHEGPLCQQRRQHLCCLQARITPENHTAAVLARTAHLLSPTEPPEALIDILHSRVAEDPDWGGQVAILRDTTSPWPRLANRWKLPDVLDPALRRVFTGHTGAVRAIEMGQDSRWLASVGNDGAVRMWDPASGSDGKVRI
ncbi:MAG: hypothetical protein ABSB01_24995 [Streptosporangiaceae bacterium]|jgi:hypothetical protein